MKKNRIFINGTQTYDCLPTALDNDFSYTYTNMAKNHKSQKHIYISLGFCKKGQAPECTFSTTLFVLNIF